jgi:UDP-N-acetylmuramate: L-alanyl-gamma-D-glutamyl-meso-diaminopimelate ligase
MRIHVLGICGTLMGSIALLARQQGHTVTGSDQNVYPPMSLQLEQAGISLQAPYSATSIPGKTELVIIGNANLARGNPAVEALLESGIAYCSGAEYLGRYVLSNKWVIAVAGTHGKTTTASMVAWILDYAKLSPGFLIGGVPTNFEYSAKLTDSKFFVIEADEYDTSFFDRRSKFLHYRPRTVILNNLEYDHADIFDNLASIQHQFHLLMRAIPGNGLIILPDDDRALEDVIRQGCWTPRVNFSTNLGSQAEVQAVLITADGAEFKVVVANQYQGTINWELTGQHNVHNACAAIAAARHAGIPPTDAIKALNEFKGVKRRMECLIDHPHLKLYDDFAHHPTAIRTTLEGLRAQVHGEIVIALIEPGSATMRKGIHGTELITATEPADQVLWMQPDNIQFQLGALLPGSDHQLFTDAEQLVQAVHDLVSVAAKRVHLVMMSNTSFHGIASKLTAKLSQ